GQLGDHHLPGARSRGVLGRNVDVLADAPLRGLDEQDPVLAPQPPDDARVDALDYLDDFPLGASALVHARLAHHDAVAVQHLAHFVRAEIEILALVGNDEAVSIGMPFDAAGDEMELRRDQDRALAVAQDLRLALHRGNAALEGFALVARDRQALGEFGIAHRHARFGERLQDQLAARYGILVARCLPLSVRILGAAVLFR